MQGQWEVGDAIGVGSSPSFRGWVDVGPADIKVNRINILTEPDWVHMLAV